MAKIDLHLINQQGYGRPVPKEMDLHIAKYVIQHRKNAVRANPELFTIERWDHSDVFYAARTHLSQHGWDVTVYNDNVVGGSKRREGFYEDIKGICENFFKVRRHEIGIYPKDRAVMTFMDSQYTVSYHNLRNQYGKGTDIVFVEKQGTVIKMSPFAEKSGVAFIDSEGFGSEYGVALARLCDQQGEAANIYTKDTNGQAWVPSYRGHLTSLTDCDVSGIGIGIKVNNARRIGLDLNTISEINEVNELELRIKDLQEGIILHPNNTHWKALQGLLRNKGKLYDSLTPNQVKYYQNYLTQTHSVDGEQVRFIDWLEHNRIELNTVIYVAKPTAVWNWLKWKLADLWPERNANRAMFFDNYLRSPTMSRFIDWYDERCDKITADKLKEKKDELCNYNGIIDNVEAEQEEIENDVINNTLLPDEQIQKIDLALEGIMNNDGKAN